MTDAPRKWNNCEKVIAFGDGDYLFKLPLKWIKELERSTDSGIGGLFLRFTTYQFSVTDICETIRCGLIGGGMDPVEAMVMIETYVEGFPIEPSLNLATSIVVGCVEGYPSKAPKKKSDTPDGEKPSDVFDYAKALQDLQALGVPPEQAQNLTLYEYGCLIDGANLRASAEEDKPPTMSNEKFDELMGENS